MSPRIVGRIVYKYKTLVPYMSMRSKGKGAGTPTEEVLDRVAKLVDARNDSDIARALETSPQAIYACRKRGSIPYDAVVGFARRARVSVDFLLLGKGTPLSGAGEIDPIMFETLAFELNDAAEQIRERDHAELFTSLPMFSHAVAMVYNRVIKRRVRPDQGFAQHATEEIRYLVDLWATGKLNKLSPEEKRRYREISLGILDDNARGKKSKGGSAKRLGRGQRRKGT